MNLVRNKVRNEARTMCDCYKQFLMLLEDPTKYRHTTNKLFRVNPESLNVVRISNQECPFPIDFPGDCLSTNLGHYREGKDAKMMDAYKAGPFSSKIDLVTLLYSCIPSESQRLIREVGVSAGVIANLPGPPYILYNRRTDSDDIVRAALRLLNSSVRKYSISDCIISDNGLSIGHLLRDETYYSIRTLNDAIEVLVCILHLQTNSLFNNVSYDEIRECIDYKLPSLVVGYVHSSLFDCVDIELPLNHFPRIINKINSFLSVGYVPLSNDSVNTVRCVYSGKSNGITYQDLTYTGMKITKHYKMYSFFARYERKQVKQDNNYDGIISRLRHKDSDHSFSAIFNDECLDKVNDLLQCSDEPSIEVLSDVDSVVTFDLVFSCGNVSINRINKVAVILINSSD